MRLQLLFELSARFASPTNARPRLRSGRTKLATTRSAFRALARQGHPRSTSVGPGSPGPLNIRNITRQGRWVRPFTALSQTETGPVKPPRRWGGQWPALETRQRAALRRVPGGGWDTDRARPPVYLVAGPGW